MVEETTVAKKTREDFNLSDKQKNLLDRIKNEGHRIAHLVGFEKFNELHAKWIQNMWKSDDIYVLKASRGSYKSSVLTLFIALLILCKPNKTIIFMRKTDNDVKEIVEKVSKILQTPQFQAFSQILYGHGYTLTKNTAFEINTTLKTDLGGKSQLIALGSSGSLTGKHSDYIIVDDLCFIGGTKIATPFGNKNIEDIKVGDLVLTPIGYKKVINTSNHEDEVITNCGLTGTANHPVYNFLLNKFDFLVTSDYNNCSKLNLKELLQWQIAKILSYGTDENGKEQVENIISYGQIINTGLVKCCIEQYGKNILVKFPKVMLFIILTIIQIIMTLAIWNVYQIGNIVKDTCENLKELLNPKKLLKILLFRNLKNGEKQKKDKKDLRNTVIDWQNNILTTLLMPYAQDVDNLSKCIQQEGQGCVENVENIWQVNDMKKKRKLKDRLILAMLKLLVPNAEKYIEQISTQETKMDCAKIVQNENDIEKNNKQRVYNLEVEDINVYYANGILVHNCNIKDRTSHAERERIKLVWMELQNVRNRGGRTIAVGTNWHSADVFSLMPPADIYTCYDCCKYGIMTMKEIENLKKTMTPALFAANYELKFIANEDAIFTDIRYLKPSDMTEQEIKDGVKPKDLLDGCVAHLDASYGGDDTTALTLMKKLSDGRIIAFGKVWDKHVKHCMNDITMLCNFYNYRTLWMETNGDKGYLAKEFRDRGMKVMTYHEKMNKDVKIQTYLYGAWQDIYWLEETDPNYVNQIMDYTENAEIVDAPDSGACACRLLNKGKVKALSGFDLV